VPTAAASQEGLESDPVNGVMLSSVNVSKLVGNGTVADGDGLNVTVATGMLLHLQLPHTPVCGSEAHTAPPVLSTPHLPWPLLSPATFVITFNSLGCTSGLPLMSARATSIDAVVATGRLQAAPQALRGGLLVSFLGSQFAEVPVDTTPSELSSALQSLGVGAFWEEGGGNVCLTGGQYELDPIDPLVLPPPPLVRTGGSLFRVTRTGECGNFRWRVTFGSATADAVLPLLTTRFSEGTVGADRFTNTSRLQTSSETVAPLPGSVCRVPVSLPNSMCSQFDTVPDLFDRNVTLPVVVAVRGRVAACGLDNPVQPAVPSFREARLLCAIETRSDVTPVVLSVIPSQGKCVPLITAETLSPPSTLQGCALIEWCVTPSSHPLTGLGDGAPSARSANVSCQRDSHRSGSKVRGGCVPDRGWRSLWHLVDRA
jgi:hypothetical protein